jgi:hypothetical protein
MTGISATAAVRLPTWRQYLPRHPLANFESTLCDCAGLPRVPESRPLDFVSICFYWIKSLKTKKRISKIERAFSYPNEEDA